MKINFRDYFTYLFLFVFILHQFIFLDFIPNDRNSLGHDYAFFLPNFIFGKIWFQNNLLNIPWYTPSFCSGIPFYSDPQTMYYSIQQIFFIIFEPITALRITFFYFSILGYLGMFFLLRTSFKCSKISSLLGATLFIFNSFFIYRFIIGHLTYASFILVPLAGFLLCYTCNVKNTYLKILNLSVASLLFASFFQSGSGALIILLVTSIFFIVLVYYFLEKQYSIFKFFLLVVLLGSCISFSKITSTLFYLQQFPRVMEPIIFENTYDFLKVAFNSLFLYPDLNGFVSTAINKESYRIDVHEIEYGLSIVPLIVFLIFLFKIKTFKEILFKKYVFFIIILTIFIPIIFNVEILNSQEFLKKIPIIKSTWVKIRWIGFYIIPIIFFSVFVIEKVFSERIKHIIIIFFISLLCFQTLYYDKSYYHDEDYSPKNMINFHNKINNGERIAILGSGVVTKKNKQRISSPNDTFSLNLSSLGCYQPIFNYDLANFPKKNIILNKKRDLGKDFNLYSGDLIIKDNEENFNFFNPTCFIFPNENNCKIGHLFSKNNEENFKNFINYKKFDFKSNTFQKISNFISIFSLITVTFLLLISLFFIFKNRLKK